LFSASAKQSRKKLRKRITDHQLRAITSDPACRVGEH
jgi:hypothetical protein